MISLVSLLFVLSFQSLSHASQPDLKASVSAPKTLSQFFDQGQEFPNLFLPPEYRKLAPDQIPASVVAESHRLLEQALGSVFSRLVLPILHPNESAPRLTRYFPYLQTALGGVDPGVKVYASGGVVRSAITYLYDVIYKEQQKNPGRSPHDVLRQFVQVTHDLPGGEVRGVGSDFDLLIESPAGKDSELQRLAGRLTNSAAESFGSGVSGGAIRNSLFAMGDVRSYAAQIDRSTRQGGSTIDYLAFDVVGKSLRNPPRFPQISQDLVRGTYEFAAPVSADAVEDQADTVIRGYRTLLETPWLKLKDDRVFREGISNLKEDLKSRKPPSPRAKGQFSKGLRNARYSGAGNRFYRSKPGSVEAEFMGYARELGRTEGANYIPEFVDFSPIEGRRGNRAELNGLPAELLEDPKAFIQTQTRGGKIFHGTPSVENALAILRQGLFLSKDGQGVGAYGRGAYSSSELSVSQSYAGSAGVVFELTVKDDPRVNILDWKKHSSHPFLRKIEAEAEAKGRDVFEVLSREHGIDVIKNNHLLIQNSEAVLFPKGLKAILDPLASQFRGKTSLANKDIRPYSEFKRLLEYASGLGETPALSPEEILKLDRLFVPIALKSPERDLGVSAAKLIDRMPKEQQLPLFKKAIQDSDDGIAISALKNDWNGIDVYHRQELLTSALSQKGERLQAPAIAQFRLLPESLRDLVAKTVLERRSAQAFPHLFIQAHYVDGQGPASELASWIEHGLAKTTHEHKVHAAGWIGRLPADRRQPFLESALNQDAWSIKMAALESVGWKSIPLETQLQIIQGFFQQHAYEARAYALKRFLELSPELQERVASAVSKNKAADVFPYELVRAYYADRKESSEEFLAWLRHGLKSNGWRRGGQFEYNSEAAKLIGKAPLDQQASLIAQTLEVLPAFAANTGLESLDWKNLPFHVRGEIFQTIFNKDSAGIEFALDRFRELSPADRGRVAELMRRSKILGHFPQTFIQSYYERGLGGSPADLPEWIEHGLEHRTYAGRVSSAGLIGRAPVETQGRLLELALSRQQREDASVAAVAGADWKGIPFSDQLTPLREMFFSESDWLKTKASVQFSSLPPEFKRQLAALMLQNKADEAFPDKFIRAYYADSQRPGPSAELEQWIERGLKDPKSESRAFAAEMIGKLPAELQSLLFEKAWKTRDFSAQLDGLKSVNWNAIPAQVQIAVLQDGLNSEVGTNEMNRALSERFRALSTESKHRLAASLRQNKRDNVFPSLFIDLYYGEGHGPIAEVPEWVEHGLNCDDFMERIAAASYIEKAPKPSQGALFLKALDPPGNERLPAVAKIIDFDSFDQTTQTRLVLKLSKVYHRDLREIGTTQFFRLPQSAQEEVLKTILDQWSSNSSIGFSDHVLFAFLDRNPAALASKTSQELLKKALLDRSSEVAERAIGVLVKAANHAPDKIRPFVERIVLDREISSDHRKTLLSQLPKLGVKYKNNCVLWIQDKLRSLGSSQSRKPSPR